MITGDPEYSEEFFAWARAHDCTHEALARAMATARAQCEQWQVVGGRAERVGTEVRDVAIAKCVATYLADPKVPKAKRKEKAAVGWAASKEAFEGSGRTVRYAVAKHPCFYQLGGRSGFLINGLETPFDVERWDEEEPLLLPAPPAEWAT